MYKAPLETPKNQRIPEKIAIYIIQDWSSEGINSPLQIYIKKIIKNNTQNIQRRFYAWRLTQSCFEEIQEKDTTWFRHLVTNGKHIATYSIHVYGFFFESFLFNIWSKIHVHLLHALYSIIKCLIEQKERPQFNTRPFSLKANLLPTVLKD